MRPLRPLRSDSLLSAVIFFGLCLRSFDLVPVFRFFLEWYSSKGRAAKIHPLFLLHQFFY